MRTGLFPKKRISLKKLHSRKGASVVFALVGFMFAAMIAFVVITAAYSAAARVKKLKYDEQSFLLAQSMSGVIIEALTGTGQKVILPDGTVVTAPGGGEYKSDGLALSYQYIEQKNATDGKIIRYYNTSDGNSLFTRSDETGSDKKTFTTLNGTDPASLTDPKAAVAVQKMVLAMAKKIDQGTATSVTDTLTTTFDKAPTGEVYNVTTTFTMDSSYSITARTIAEVITAGGSTGSTYVVRMDAGASARTDKFICVGIKDPVDDNIIGAAFTDKTADAAGEELVKISCYSVTWPPEQMRNVYAP